jgi:hypothetical protein
MLLRLLLLFLCFFIIASCNDASESTGLNLGNFIKPTYSKKESFYKCNLVNGETLNSVERFIPNLVESFSQIGDSSEELFFLFPIERDGLQTTSFQLLLKHKDILSLDKLDLALSALSFDEIALCENPTISYNSMKITKETIDKSPAIVEVLECGYLKGYDYATIKLALEQFNDALVKNKSPVDVVYSGNPVNTNQFQWTNIFSSQDSRAAFIKSWQTLGASKEIQELLLEQSECKSSKLYSRYKVL